MPRSRAAAPGRARFAVLLSLALAPAAAAEASLAGDWQIGSVVISVSQAGRHVRAVWKQPAEGCKAGALWWEGDVDGPLIRGQRYPCTGDSLQEPLSVDIVDNGAALNVQIPALGGTTLFTPVR